MPDNNPETFHTRLQHVCSVAAPNLDYDSRLSIYFIDKCPLKCIGHDAYLMHDLPSSPLLSFYSLLPLQWGVWRFDCDVCSCWQRRHFSQSVSFLCIFFLGSVNSCNMGITEREGVVGSHREAHANESGSRQCKVAAPAAPCAARVRVAMAVKKIQGKHGTCKMKLMNVQSKAIYSGASSIWDGNGWHTEGSNMGND